MTEPECLVMKPSACAVCNDNGQTLNFGRLNGVFCCNKE